LAILPVGTFLTVLGFSTALMLIAAALRRTLAIAPADFLSTSAINAMFAALIVPISTFRAHGAIRPNLYAIFLPAITALVVLTLAIA
jgi:hypothetical protein